jgi:hypothetical protein
VAGLCEPRLLKDKAFTSTVLKLLNTITRKLATQDDAFNDSGFLSLRQTLGYGWSVSVAACPELGKSAFEAWAEYPGKHVQWVVKENLSKARLKKLDAQWVERLKA